MGLPNGRENLGLRRPPASCDADGRERRVGRSEFDGIGAAGRAVRGAEGVSSRRWRADLVAVILVRTSGSRGLLGVTLLSLHPGACLTRPTGPKWRGAQASLHGADFITLFLAMLEPRSNRNMKITFSPRSRKRSRSRQRRRGWRLRWASSEPIAASISSHWRAAMYVAVRDRQARRRGAGAEPLEGPYARIVFGIGC